MDLHKILKKGPLLFDGAMGTYYVKKYGHDPEYCEQANLLFPERILSIHREYIQAGASAIKTNTFSANELSLSSPSTCIDKIIETAWNIAQTAIKGTDVIIFADIGPVPIATNFNTYNQYKIIIDKFLSLGATNFIFETFASTCNLADLSRYIKTKCASSIIICSFAFSPDGYTREGSSVQSIINEINVVSEIDGFGLNCSCGPTHMLKLVSNIRELNLPLSVMPNAGYPTMVGNRMYYGNDPDYFAETTARNREYGVEIFGGCCGTTPNHIEKLNRCLKQEADNAKLHIGLKTNKQTGILENRFWNKLSIGKKVFAVELDPPQNSDISSFMQGAKALLRAGADAITIADCPVSRARADSSILACKLKRELGIDPMPHLTCRDRNIIATKALLLGLNIEGINNVLVVTGDPVPMEDRNYIKSVFNFNSTILSSFISELGDELINGPFKIFAALNVNALNFPSQLDRAKAKLEQGVVGFLTQPIHSERALENLRIARRELNCFILGGIMPIVSYRNACYMNSEISGMAISDQIIKQYEGLDRDSASILAVSLTTEIGKCMSAYTDGYYMITPFMRTDLTCEIMNNLK